MANSKDKEPKLDKGFEEVALDDGFEEVPVDVATPDPDIEPISQIEAVAAGALLDGPFGFGDEITGAVGAGAEVAFGDPKLEDFKRLYQEYRDAARDVGKRAHDQHPGTTLASGIAGGLVIPMGWIGAAGKGLKGLKGAQEAAQVAKAADAAKKASMLTRMGEMALTGGRAGVVTGLGQTEDIGNVKQVVEDMGMYGAGGAVFGGAMPPLAFAAKKTAEGIGAVGEHLGYKLFGPVKEATKIGMKGENLVTEEGVKKAGEEVAGFAKEVAPRLKQDLDRLGALKRKIIKQADKAGVRIDEAALDARINRALEAEPESRLPEVRRELEELQELLRTYKDGKIVRKTKTTEVPTGKEKVRQIEELKVAEQSAIESGVSPDDIETVFEPVDVPGKVAAIVRQRVMRANPETGAMEQVGYKKLASRLVDETEIPEVKIRSELVRENPADLTRLPETDQLRQDLAQKSKYGDKPFSTKEVQNMTGRLTQDVRDLERAAKPQLEKVDDAISSLKQAAESLGINDTRNIDENIIMNRIITLINNEGKGTGSGIKAREVINQFISHLKPVNPKLAQKIQGNFERLSNKMDTIGHIHGKLEFLGLSGVRNLATGAGNLAGYGLYRLSRLPKDRLGMIADDIARTKAGKAAETVGNTLSQALQKDERGKNAILFGLMQNPAYRQILQDYIPQIEDEEEAK